ncbi:bifunctional tRNA (5-methylaminomethyl-2-thiouridine)(34)-methyltransferase MnmD/FAD-dependent 5-carboxymethylaminomethyl-2-thiouridine(34) oxidoreductase MnmC [Litoribacillus peritrichatus]|uniref:tRNA 5-methylaminomethyl-2-thiouridine biosynthesis bifunctional protein MnmC n=1 Tax=Litoribacillus peritrichatus TaxID=718191 RepID=A0ABP7M8T7_9GAMM
MKHADVKWYESGTPCSLQFDDVYFSTDGGLDETRYIFLEHNRLEERFALLAHEQQPKAFVIAETGFGTGLNFLAVCQMWDKYLANTPHKLEFISTEKYPLTHGDIERAMKTWPELTPWAAPLTENYPKMCAGFQKVIINKNISLLLAFGDAADSFAQIAAKVDAWFLDGFAPAKNPDIWSPALFTQVQRLSHTETTYATFTAARVVRDLLAEHGFTVVKDVGFGVKREMIYGCAVPEKIPHRTVNHQSLSANTQVWNKVQKSQQNETQARTATIIGAGLSGAHTAHALAKKGWKVTVLEQEAQIASGASGNFQGVIYTKPASKETKEDGFYLSSFQYAVQHYRHHFSEIQNETIWKQTGLLQLAQTPEDETRLKAVLENNPGSDLMAWQTPEQASEVSGLNIQQAALFYPDSGWVNPVKACHMLLQHENILTQCNQKVTDLFHQNSQWVITTETNQYTSDIVVLASAWESDQFSQTQHLNLTPIRGQVSRLSSKVLKSNGLLSDQKMDIPSPNVVICSDAYVTPTDEGYLNFGATFDLKDTNTEYRTEDVEKNLEKLKQISDDFTPLDQVATEEFDGRAAVRCITNDRLPVVGQINDHPAMIEQYQKLRKDKNWKYTDPGKYHTGLYANLGHGSKGLTTIPLCTDLLCAIINEEPLPFPQPLVDSLSPTRFTIKGLIRNKF